MMEQSYYVCVNTIAESLLKPLLTDSMRETICRRLYTHIPVQLVVWRNKNYPRLEY